MPKNQTSTSFTYDDSGNVLTQTDPGGKTTTFTYSSAHRLTDILDAANGNTHITYDAKGNIASYSDPAGALTQIQRDTKGNITSVTDPLGHVVQYAYDQFNNVVSVTDAANVTTTFTHDASGNVLTATDALGHTTAFAYDAAGQLASVTDPLGNVTGFGYDGNGNRMLTTDPMQNNTLYSHNFRRLPTQRTDAHGAITTFAYGGTGCSSCNGGGEKLTALTDAVGSTTSFVYDQRGLLTAITDPLQRITSLAYNSMGRPTGKTDRNGTVLAYGYTASGKLSTVTYPDQSQVVNGYDSLDRLTATSEPLGVSSYTYDAAGRITGFTDPHGFSISYIYDAAGNLTQITYPDSTAVTYAYDAANRLTTVTDWASGLASFTYDQAGRLATFTQFNGITTTYTYDIASRLTGMSSPVASYQFTLDGNGNRTNSVENEPLPPALSLGSTIYDYNARRNRLLAAGDANYTYDNEGQLATAGGTVLTFNCDNRLAEINESGTVHQFSYDSRSSRIKVIRDGVETRYIYDPFGNLLAEADSLNQITRKYIYGKGLLALATPTARYCYHFNPTGSTIAITDMAQSVVNAYTYEPFGQILAQQETLPQPFKFVGRYGVMAEPNGLYYMRARYYDPGVGRFICEDPIGFAGGDVNLHAYVVNNPVNRIDPFGLCVDVCVAETALVWGIGAIIVGEIIKEGSKAKPKEPACPKEEDQECPPCRLKDGTIAPIGTIAFRWDKLAPTVKQHGIYGDHLNLYRANQNPNNCKCFWQPTGTVAPPPQPGWIPIQPFANSAIPGTAWLRTVERGHGGTQAGFIRSDEIEEQVLGIVYPDRVRKAKQVIENPAKRWIGYESGAGSENTAITSRRTGLQVGLF
ncbi:MAG: RHS repeat-associated core domain-containing protein [Syntrophobacteraceae bacterium]